MFSEEEQEIIRRIMREVLVEHGFPRLPSTAAQRQARYRERKAQALVSKPDRNESVTQAITKRNENVPQGVTRRNTKGVTKHNGASHVTLAAWESYAVAYRQRYGVDPVRNAKVNGQFVQLVKRVGEDAAPMAGWFISHGAARYVQGGHSVGLLLMDAEKLHTEWQTGRRVTATAAQQSDRTTHTADVFGKLIEEVRHYGKIA